MLENHGLLCLYSLLDVANHTGVIFVEISIIHMCTNQCVMVCYCTLSQPELVHSHVTLDKTVLSLVHAAAALYNNRFPEVM